MFEVTGAVYAACVCAPWFNFRISYCVTRKSYLSTLLRIGLAWIPQQILTVAGAATAKHKKQGILWSGLADKATRKGKRVCLTADELQSTRAQV
jgi:hypothetical protein